MPIDKFRSRNQNTVLGNAWNLLNPLLTAAVYFLIFGVILNASRGIDNFILWLVVGLFAFRLTQSTVQLGAISITGNQGLVRSLRFPRVLLPTASSIGELITFAFEVVILLVFAIATGEGLSWRLVFMPAVVALHTMFNLACAMIAARLNDSFRDFERFLPFVFQISRYLSGVMIPLARFEEQAPKAIHVILSSNPLVWILDMYRWVFLGDASGVTMLTVLLAAGISLAFFAFALKFFVAAEHRYGRP